MIAFESLSSISDSETCLDDFVRALPQYFTSYKKQKKDNIINTIKQIFIQIK